MKYKKAALISKNEISSWKSCQHISNNLAESYFKAFESQESQSFKVPEDMSLFYAITCASKIKENGCDVIVWLDHKPNAAKMLEALDIVFSGVEFKNKPPFIIHLFGDFVLDCLGWESVEAALKNYPIHFVAASERQKKLVDTFFTGTKTLSSVIPFPVNEKAFNVDNFVDNRKEYRQKFSAGNDFVILYTGRISYQKNVDKIIKIFHSLRSFTETKLQLWIAGPWDDILLPYAGIKGVPGSYYSQFEKTVGKLDDSVKFLGQLDSHELLKIYQASDLFMSLSTYNDEDYGMSVAEALGTGLPCLLSDWGGFSSFTHYSPVVNLVQVELGDSGPGVNAEEARKKLMKEVLTHRTSPEERRKSSEIALKELSINAQAERIEKLLNELEKGPLHKVNPAFYKMCALFKMNPQAPFKDRNSTLSEFYKEIYKNYVS